MAAARAWTSCAKNGISSFRPLSCWQPVRFLVSMTKTNIGERMRKGKGACDRGGFLVNIHLYDTHSKVLSHITLVPPDVRLLVCLPHVLVLLLPVCEEGLHLVHDGCDATRDLRARSIRSMKALQ